MENDEFYGVGQNIRNKVVMKLFGSNLKRIREARGLTQEYLAEEAGISQTQITRIESGTLNTSISTLHSLVQALDCGYNDLFKQ